MTAEPGGSEKPAPEPAPPPPPPAPTIHEAVLASGVSGAVEYGAEIDLNTAVARRRAGGDVVVRGNDLRANRTLAPHDRIGGRSLRTR
jgi:hypothetical protein